MVGAGVLGPDFRGVGFWNCFGVVVTGEDELGGIKLVDMGGLFTGNYGGSRLGNDVLDAGVGELHGGDGWYGLYDGFLDAGAREVHHGLDSNRGHCEGFVRYECGEKFVSVCQNFRKTFLDEMVIKIFCLPKIQQVVTSLEQSIGQTKSRKRNQYGGNVLAVVITDYKQLIMNSR